MVQLRLSGRRSVHLGALAPPACGFRLLFAALHTGLHVVPAHLELAKHAFGGELALEHLDGPLDTAVAYDHLERLALNCITGHSLFTDLLALCHEARGPRLLS